MIKYKTNIRIDQDVDFLLIDNPVLDPNGKPLPKEGVLKYHLIQALQAKKLSKCEEENSANVAGLITSAGA